MLGLFFLKSVLPDPVILDPPCCNFQWMKNHRPNPSGDLHVIEDAALRDLAEKITHQRKHIPFGNQTWLAGKSRVNGGFNGKIIQKIVDFPFPPMVCIHGFIL